MMLLIPQTCPLTVDVTVQLFRNWHKKTCFPLVDTVGPGEDITREKHFSGMTDLRIKTGCSVADGKAYSESGSLDL